MTFQDVADRARREFDFYMPQGSDVAVRNGIASIMSDLRKVPGGDAVLEDLTPARLLTIAASADDTSLLQIIDSIRRINGRPAPSDDPQRK